VATSLGIDVITHAENRGYGANQKTCYRAALARHADIVVMLHPDNQYDARCIPVMTRIVELGICDVVLGNRIRSRRQVLIGGMPKWKYFANRTSTFVENFILGTALGDFHSGFRAYSGGRFWRQCLLSQIPTTSSLTRSSSCKRARWDSRLEMCLSLCATSRKPLPSTSGGVAGTE